MALGSHQYDRDIDALSDDARLASEQCDDHGDLSAGHHAGADSPGRGAFWPFFHIEVTPSRDLS